MSSPHPDDERLSAALDGHDPEASAHADGCGQCAARLAQLRAVADLVGAPVAAPDADATGAAVAAALGAVVVTPMRRRRPAPLALAAAALVAVVLASVALLGGGGDEQDVPAALSGEGASSPAADLGDQSDPSALRDRLQAVVEPPPAAATDSGAPEQSEAAASRRVINAPVRATPDGGSSSGPPCTATAAKEYGTGLGPLVYRAALRWEGTPAVALVYQVEGATGPLDHRVLVMATGDCRLLVVQTF